MKSSNVSPPTLLFFFKVVDASASFAFPYELWNHFVSMWGKKAYWDIEWNCLESVHQYVHNDIIIVLCFQSINMTYCSIYLGLHFPEPCFLVFSFTDLVHLMLDL